MSKENVMSFMELIGSDESLAMQIYEASIAYADREEKYLENMTDDDKKQAISAIIMPIAEKQGIEFTVDEYFEAELEAMRQLNAEMDAEELEKVAGGMTEKRPQYDISAIENSILPGPAISIPGAEPNPSRFYPRPDIYFPYIQPTLYGNPGNSKNNNLTLM